MRQDLFPYLTDPIDKIVLAAMPTLMVPINGKLLPPLDGEARFVVSAKGLHLEAKTSVLEIRFLVAESSVALP